MLPVFTRVEHVATAVQMNPKWQSLQVIEVDGQVLLGDLDEEVGQLGEREVVVREFFEGPLDAERDLFEPFVGDFFENEPRGMARRRFLAAQDIDERVDRQRTGQLSEDLRDGFFLGNALRGLIAARLP